MDCPEHIEHGLNQPLNTGLMILTVPPSSQAKGTQTTSFYTQTHTGQCKRTGGYYNELVVAFFSTDGGVKGKKIYTCLLYYLFINLHLFYL